MAFINQAVTVLQTLVIALGAGLAVWGVVNLMEGYTSITSLSHISKVAGHQAAHGWRRCGADRHDPYPPALRFVRLIHGKPSLTEGW